MLQHIELHDDIQEKVSTLKDAFLCDNSQGTKLRKIGYLSQFTPYKRGCISVFSVITILRKLSDGIVISCILNNVSAMYCMYYYCIVLCIVCTMYYLCSLPTRTLIELTTNGIKLSPKQIRLDLRRQAIR